MTRRNHASRARYEIWLGPPNADPSKEHEWYRHLAFDELERAMQFMRVFDPDGMIPMKVHDLWEDKDLDFTEYLYEHDRRIAARKKKGLDEPKGDWQQEGF